MKVLKKVLSERGSIAIMMVITSVLIITPVMINFTVDTSVNKLKVANIEDRFKARLTAESGLKFAISRLRLYKEAYNFLQQNEKAKDLVKQETLDVIWNFPFIFPIPVTKKMNAIQKDAIKEFNEKTNLEGSLQLTIENISNKINLNLLRVSLLLDAQKEAAEGSQSSGSSSSGTETETEFDAESQLIKILSDAIEAESEKDEVFSAEHYGTEVDILINELKYFISDPNSIEDAAGGDTNFTTQNLTPKKSPLISFSEIYSLPGWPDAISNLITNEFTVHGAIMIDLNKITDKLLRVLIPDIGQEDIDEFFKYKDDPEDPHFFNSLDDFKNYMVNIGNVMKGDEFTERFDKFLKQGLKFGQTPTLFKVNCVGRVGRSTYKLTAYLTLPAQPKPRPKKKANEPEPNEPEPNKPDPNKPDPNKPDPNDPKPNKPDPNAPDPKEQKTLLLNPRIIEIIVG